MSQDCFYFWNIDFGASFVKCTKVSASMLYFIVLINRVAILIDMRIRFYWVRCLDVLKANFLSAMPAGSSTLWSRGRRHASWKWGHGEKEIVGLGNCPKKSRLCCSKHLPNLAVPSTFEITIRRVPCVDSWRQVECACLFLPYQILYEDIEYMHGLYSASSSSSSCRSVNRKVSSQYNTPHGL